MLSLRTTRCLRRRLLFCRSVSSTNSGRGASGSEVVATLPEQELLDGLLQRGYAKCDNFLDDNGEGVEAGGRSFAQKVRQEMQQLSGEQGREQRMAPNYTHFVDRRGDMELLQKSNIFETTLTQQQPTSEVLQVRNCPS